MTATISSGRGASSPSTSGTVFITGGASGIGRACSERLAADGRTVVVADRDLDGARRVAEQIGRRGGIALAVEVRVDDADSVGAAIDLALDHGGPITAMVASAGVAAAPGPVGTIDIAEWHRVIGVNLTGSFLTLRATLGPMAAAGGGAAVLIGSVMSQVASTVGSAAYVAAKHGVVGLARQAAVDHARDGIRVNAVLPGYIDTPMARQRLTEQELTERVGRHPIGRLGRPEDVAAAVAWLLGPDAAFVTGTAVPVDGGFLSI